jgi:hypothetical protein
MARPNNFNFYPEIMVPINLNSVPKNPVPPQGTLPRCVHSHYAPRGDAFHCEACHPIRPGIQRNVFLPKRHVKDDDALFANAHGAGRCPKCNSAIHVEVPTGWMCAECQTIYKAPRKNSVAETELEVVA